MAWVAGAVEDEALRCALLHEGAVRRVHPERQVPGILRGHGPVVVQDEGAPAARPAGESSEMEP